MKRDIYDHVKTCQKCQESRSLTQKAFGTLRPFSTTTAKVGREIDGFHLRSSADGTQKPVILVVVDKLSKRTHFISLHSSHTTLDTEKVFYKEIYKHRGLPKKMISDRDTRFTSNFWTELMKPLNIKLNLSTSFHPQTDGQSERAFRTIQELLRCLVSYSQKDWPNYLPGLEFTYNNHISESTKQNPFFVEYGQHPFSTSDFRYSDESTPSNPATQSFIKDIENANEIAKEAIKQANACNADY